MPPDNTRYVTTSPNGVDQWIYTSHQPRERDIKLPPLPTQDGLKHWKAQLVAAARYAADRTDEKATEMVMETLDPTITFEDLAYVGPQVRRFDRKLIYAIKQIIKKTHSSIKIYSPKTPCARATSRYPCPANNCCGYSSDRLTSHTHELEGMRLSTWLQHGG